jgi:hypothetical protein
MANMTKWTVSVSKETDISVRTFLAQRGMKKGDLSKFIEDAVKWRVLDRTLAEVRGYRRKAEQTTKNVGWVERSETHHPAHVTMGFAALYPSYKSGQLPANG